MKKMRIYCDNDNTLTAPVWAPAGGNEIIDVMVRPKAEWFLEQLSKHGDVYIITAATKEYAEVALSKLGEARKFIKGVLSREDMLPISDKIVDIECNGELEWIEKERLYQQIKPIAPEGFIFDDYPTGGWLYRLKSKVIGIDESKWIKVKPFGPNDPDNSGLEKAFAEFIERSGVINEEKEAH
jgi:hypothetical protein